MKKTITILMVMVMILVGFTAQAQAERRYSIDKFDGTYHQTHDRSISKNTGDLMVAHGIGVKSYSWVTFKVSNVDWENAKSVTLSLYETANYNNDSGISLHVVPYEYAPNFNCLEQGEEVLLHRHHWLKYTSENLLPQLKKIAKNKGGYVTLAIVVNPGPGWAGTIAFADGNPLNLIFRPYLEIKY
ncbi:MAG: hypothetical protein GF365_05390 [Candidatus Buchananbacteria bacterium]|nr:hypothetical protein [Candidatus Buchananbacteria bacterium]